SPVGAFEPIAVEPLPWGGGFTASCENLGRLYVAARSNSDELITFAIDRESGLLETVAMSRFSFEPCALTLDHDCRFLFAGSYVSNSLTVSQVGSSGVPGSPFQVIDDIARAHDVVVDPTGAFVFVPSLGDGCVVQFNRRGSGRLTRHDPPAVAIGAASG